MYRSALLTLLLTTEAFAVRPGPPGTSSSSLKTGAGAELLIICAESSQVFSLGRGGWTRQLERWSLHQSDLFVNDAQSLFVRRGDDWSRWSPNEGLSPLPMLTKNPIAELRTLSDGRLLWATSQFHGIRLHGDKGQALVKERGAKNARVRSDGAYLYAVQPKIGGEELPFFTDLIKGSKMKLKVVLPGKKAKVLATAPVIANPRFASDRFVIYWRSGKVDERRNYKTWILESVDLKSGRRKKQLTYEGRIRNGKRWVRGAPMLRSFEDSNWILTTEGHRQQRAEQYVAMHLGSGAVRSLRLPYNRTLVASLRGHQEQALVATRNKTRPSRVSVWDVTQQRMREQYHAPCQATGATFMDSSSKKPRSPE